MSRRYRILLLDHDEEDLALLQSALVGHDLTAAARASEARRWLDRRAFDAVVAAAVADGTGADFLEAAMAEQPRAARILLAETASAEEVGDAVNRARVHRTLLKPLRPAEVEDAVTGAINEVALVFENERLLRTLETTNERLERLVDERTRELREALEALASQAVRDGLTGLYNHRFLQEALDNVLATARRNNGRVGLLFLDVDHFKAYNDTFGHVAGDRLLRELGELIAGGPGEGEGRASDIVARYGGEEFVRVLPGADREGAQVVAERIRRRVEQHRFAATPTHGGDRVSVSIGVAVYPDDGRDKQSLIDAADRALYAAKRAGRNQVRMAEWSPTGARL